MVGHFMQAFSEFSEFVFNITQKAKVILGWDHGLVSSDSLEEPEIQLRTPVNKASGSSTPQGPSTNGIYCLQN